MVDAEVEAAQVTYAPPVRPCPEGHTAQYEPDKKAYYCWVCQRYVHQAELEKRANKWFDWRPSSYNMSETEQKWWHRAACLIGRFLMERKEK